MKILEKIKFILATTLLFAIIIGVALVEWKWLLLLFIPIIGFPIVTHIHGKTRNVEKYYFHTYLLLIIPTIIYLFLFNTYYFG